jgi:ABC-2 type transport system ATP-binding protein
VLAIETKSLTRRFNGFTAVGGLSFGVEEGEIFGLLGPNGAGKTTTLRLLSCLISPTSGGATVRGLDIIRDQSAIRRSIGILTESPSLYERLTAVENLEFFAKAYGMVDKAAISQRVREVLEFFQLWDRRGDKVGTFSKGMKQKLALARALIHNPPILFLDEPTSGLDPEASKLIRDLVGRLGNLESRTIILSTHRLEDAEKLCRRVMIINKGASLVIGTVDDLRREMGAVPMLEISLASPGVAYTKVLEGVEGVERVESSSGGLKLTVSTKDVDGTAPRAIAELVRAGAAVREARIALPSLEETYLSLIKEGAE